MHPRPSNRTQLVNTIPVLYQARAGLRFSTCGSPGDVLPPHYTSSNREEMFTITKCFVFFFPLVCPSFQNWLKGIFQSVEVVEGRDAAMRNWELRNHLR
ncbi:hypothetical protein HNY73_002608 [Argiope bruennichi]|uniref:Uncharacterized protein n=1 Tax=Argiope bruennichi TaxID=94029 RepID=A0A8T0FWJ7_ARGBR|nr:hypothetical protein HNY73_002608 [Argiope bruennichi]